jgi:hypothetical protein
MRIRPLRTDRIRPIKMFQPILSTSVVMYFYAEIFTRNLYGVEVFCLRRSQIFEADPEKRSNTQLMKGTYSIL